MSCKQLNQGLRVAGFVFWNSRWVFQRAWPPGWILGSESWGGSVCCGRDKSSEGVGVTSVFVIFQCQTTITEVLV